MVLTDGNDTGSLVLPRRAASVARERGVKLYVVGVGDATAAHEESLNEDVLRDMASATGGRYLRARDRAQLHQAYAELGRLEPVVTMTAGFQPKRSVAYLPLGLIAGFLVGHMLLEFGAWLLSSSARRARNASPTMPTRRTT